FSIFSSRRRHTSCSRDWSSDVCSSDLFLFKGYGVQHHAIADQVEGVVVEHAGRNGVQHHFLVIDIQGMARIGTTLESGYNIIFARKVIYDLAFAFIAPLQPQQYIYHCIFMIYGLKEEQK